uniref:UBX domain-containing protein n=1 Tax=Glossina palpalis gambiensis TaxID=67801 RepID=A0A1B0ASF0_9MUSC
MSQLANGLVERVIEITGTTEAEAKHLLAACNNDAESAVALFFEGGGGNGENVEAISNNSVSESAPSLPVLSDAVRAPIAPIREQLIGPEDDNFYTAAPPTASSTGHRSVRDKPRVKVCPLRDFAREGALMEEQLQADSDYLAMEGLYETTATPSRPVRRERVAMVTALQRHEPKRKRLEDLFRPPTDIAFAGPFQAARSRAEALKQWLLVNVQSDSFESQLLNRDVWNDKLLRDLMKRQFLLWQVDSESSEGRRFVTFYHCPKLPYLCVIDPRTGEEMWKSVNPKQENVLVDLQHFLQEHKDFSHELTSVDESGPSTSNRRTNATISLDSDEEFTHKSHYDEDSNVKKRSKLMELTEEEQIALAIRNSMRENGINGDRNTATQREKSDNREEELENYCGSVEEFKEDDTKSVCESMSYEQQLGKSSDELTMLKLRLLNATGSDEVVQLRWPSDTLVKVLRSYIQQVHPHIPKTGYKLICAFPRKTLEKTHDDCSLKEIGLHPSANLHITLDD